MRKRGGLPLIGPLLNLPARISQLVPHEPSGSTVISIDGRWLKLLHAAGRGGSKTVTALLAKPLEGVSDEELTAWLKDACQAKNLQPASVLVANPSHLTTTRLFAVPSVDPKEIQDIVELQAEKHTPYAKEEILTDFRMIETDRTGYSRVLLVISHQDIVHRGLRVVEAMGWVLDRVGFELEGLVNWCRVSQHGMSEEGGALVAEVDADTTTLAILQQGRPYFHRNLSIGAVALSVDAADGAAKLLGEVQRSLESFEAEGLDIHIAGIVLTGQAGRFPELKERLKQGLELPVVVEEPFGHATLAEGTAEGLEAPVSFVSLLGLALRPSEVDLTPKALKLHRAFEARAQTLVGLGCQLIGALLLVSCLVIGKAQKQERYRALLRQERQQAMSQAGELEDVLERLRLVKGWIEDRNQLLGAVVELNRQTPTAVRWHSLTFTRGEQVTLKGVSEEMPKVFELAATLKESSRFSNIEARRVAKQKGEQHNTDFELVCSLASSEKANGKKTGPGS
ncbi:MAG: pilus assembly protein PilM [Candidatus Omnitrophica bacterium]|nr:pilus assembly protein PilM [Candidatus Omnitrophota bacterium]